MIKAFITGEEGFIARNLRRIGILSNRLGYINPWLKENCHLNDKGEIDFVETDLNKLKRALVDNECNVIIHNGASVGTDVCALNSRRAIMNNVLGTYNIATIAKELKIPIVYIGTTVIYDTQILQKRWLTEEDPIFPRTLYATTKYEGELIIRAYCQESKYCILRPLFCYGGEGDMNSLIAKTIFNDVTGRKKNFKIFLNPEKIKDYMHVDDFCSAIVEAATMNTILTSNDDYNISADNPVSTRDIVDEIEYNGIDTSYIQWIPETDYLGNHRVDNAKFKHATRGCWEPKISLATGVKMVRESYGNHTDVKYDPFKHLDNIEKNDINIETHYNFKG